MDVDKFAITLLDGVLLRLSIDKTLAAAFEPDDGKRHDAIMEI
jgi:hypothetical protein